MPAGSSRHRDAGGDARHHLEANALFVQEQRLGAAAVEHEGIAPLEPRDHLAFGTGPHVCPGATLARMEATVLLQEFTSRVRAFEPVAGFEIERTPVFWALGHRSLPVTLTPA